jgi:ABC-type multidrug transport system ATPase subunit
LEAVSKRFGRREPAVLRDVDLRLDDGSVIALLGANGSGKSTLLRLLAGLTRPTSGRVHVGAVRTGYVPERFPANLRFGTRDYLEHMASIGSVADGPAAVAAVIGRLSLDPDAPRIDRLSKGTRQRVALGQALLGDPDLLLLDEPWTGLDAAVRSEALAAVAERRAAGACVVIADHRWPRELAPDRVLRISDGRVGDVGDVRAAGVSTVESNVTVELRPPAGGGDGRWRLPPWDGVRSAERSDGVVRLQVDPARVQDVLRLALGDGAAVVRVDPGGDA